MVAFEWRIAIPSSCSFRASLIDLEFTEDIHIQRLGTSQFRLDSRTRCLFRKSLPSLCSGQGWGFWASSKGTHIYHACPQRRSAPLPVPYAPPVTLTDEERA